MNPSKFDTIVKNRAQERVSARIIKFRQEIVEAITRLDPLILPNLSEYPERGWWPNSATKGDLGVILNNISKGLIYEDCSAEKRCDYKRVKWPRSLWEREELAVQKELLAVMDEMQRALVAPPADDSSIQPMGDENSSVS